MTATTELDLEAIRRREIARIERIQASDERHRAAGEVMCWCSKWVPADQTIDGTCGDHECLRAEADDRRGLVP